MRKWLLGLLILCPVLAFGAESENKVWKKGDPWPYPRLELHQVIVDASAAYADDKFIYDYTVVNSSQNSLPIYRFEIDLRNDPTAHPFPCNDLTPRHNKRAHFKAIMGVPRVIPIEQSYPKRWDAHQNRMGNDIWSSKQLGTKGTTIKPNEQLSGFRMTASEPPGIRQYSTRADLMYRESYLRRLSFEEHNFYDRSLEFRAESAKGIEFINKTIAPVSPPEPFTVSSWAVHMEQLSNEAHELGWIKTDKQLEQIRKYIGALNTKSKWKLKKAVKSIEKHVLKELEAGNLTTEADALIRLNALYLLKRISEAKQEVKESTDTAHAATVEEYMPKVILSVKWGEGEGEMGFVKDYKNPIAPRALFTDKSIIYLLDSANLRVAKYDKNGRFVGVVPLEQIKESAEYGRLDKVSEPFQIAPYNMLGAAREEMYVDNEGNIYVTGYGGANRTRVYVFRKDGRLLKEYTRKQLGGYIPHAETFFLNGAGDIYVRLQEKFQFDPVTKSYPTPKVAGYSQISTSTVVARFAPASSKVNQLQKLRNRYEKPIPLPEGLDAQLSAHILQSRNTRNAGRTTITLDGEIYETVFDENNQQEGFKLLKWEEK